jgi:hypothetical protein
MSWQADPHGCDGADHVAPPFLDTRTAGLLQPLPGAHQLTCSVTTATTPGWNGSAAVLGSVPAATANSWTLGAGRGVGTGVAAGVGVTVGVG